MLEIWVIAGAVVLVAFLLARYYVKTVDVEIKLERLAHERCVNRKPSLPHQISRHTCHDPRRDQFRLCDPCIEANSVPIRRE